MTARTHIAVIDIGKTNAKLALVDLQTLTEIAVVTRPNVVLPGPPWPHFDTEAQWTFLLASLRKFHQTIGVDGISVTTHGASAALLDVGGGLAAPVLDYEHDGLAETAAAYDTLRPDFTETGSPRLAVGLNLGAQLHWQFQTDPGLMDRTAHIVTYPQYWAFCLTGVAATDVTSLGCHTDLWDPGRGAFSSLVDKLGIADKIAPARKSGDILGTILPQVAEVTGLPKDTPVTCGIHDSNASLYPHILTQRAPFSVVSTGTWVITMAVGGRTVDLDPARDTLINVNALGQPVWSARFMGGRDYEIIRQGRSIIPTEDDRRSVLETPVFLTPSVQPDCGPFPGQLAGWLPAEPGIKTGTRMVALSYYLALMTAECLTITGAEGPIIVEGPFGRNKDYLSMLQAATGRDVMASTAATGTSIGAALMFAPEMTEATEAMPTPQAPHPLCDYAKAWQKHVALG